MVAGGQAWRGIIIDGAGIGSCMVANKVPGVRAAMCYDQATAVNSREHNNANVLTLGAGLIGPSLAKQIVQTWLATDFAGGRHARRVDKIDRIGHRYAKQFRVNLLMKDQATVERIIEEVTREVLLRLTQTGNVGRGPSGRL